MKWVLITLGIIVLILAIYIIFIRKQVIQSGSALGGDPEIQARINRILTSSDWASWRDNHLAQLKTGGAHGVPADRTTAMKEVFRASVSDYTKQVANPGTFEQYTYPNIELYSVPDGTTTPGTDRDRGSSGLFGGGSTNPGGSPSLLSLLVNGFGFTL